MAVSKDIRELLEEGTIVFDNPAYDNSIIGMTHDGRAVYSYFKMVHELMEDDNLEYDEAMDFIEYNTMRVLPYAGAQAPVVFYTWEDLYV
jgi:hypothetical protein